MTSAAESTESIAASPTSEESAVVLSAPSTFLLVQLVVIAIIAVQAHTTSKKTFLILTLIRLKFLAKVRHLFLIR